METNKTCIRYIESKEKEHPHFDLYPEETKAELHVLWMLQYWESPLLQSMYDFRIYHKEGF